MFVHNLAVMRPSREVGNLEEKHFPWGKTSLKKAIIPLFTLWFFWPEVPFSFPEVRGSLIFPWPQFPEW